MGDHGLPYSPYSLKFSRLIIFAVFASYKKILSAGYRKFYPRKIVSEQNLAKLRNI